MRREYKYNKLSTKNFNVTLRTVYGTLTVNGIKAKNEDEAFDKAVNKSKAEIDYAKLDEIKIAS